MDITLQQVYQAQKTIRPFCLKTLLVPSPPLAALAGSPVFLKLETLQPTGAFKVRGAANKISRLSSAERKRGVITASTGNHGRAVSYIAGQMGLRATVCISEDVPENKAEAIRRLGAEVVVYGKSQDDAFLKVAEHQQRFGKVLVHPFDDLAIIAGQATIGLELIEDLPQLEMALVPLSGGGLISGIAFALKAINPAIQVIGVSMERAPVMYHSQLAGKPTQLAEEETLADSLRGGIGLDNCYTFRMVQNFVDEIVLVSEEEIAAAMAYLFREHRLAAEGAGAVGIAALLAQKVPSRGKNIAVVISGNNVSIQQFSSVVQPYL